MYSFLLPQDLKILHLDIDLNLPYIASKQFSTSLQCFFPLIGFVCITLLGLLFFGIEYTSLCFSWKNLVDEVQSKVKNEHCIENIKNLNLLHSWIWYSLVKIL